MKSVAVFIIALLTLVSGLSPQTVAAEKKIRIKEISWSHAQSLIMKGKVKSATQAHSREVKLFLKDGKALLTIEPQINDVQKTIKECGDRCRQMTLEVE